MTTNIKKYLYIALSFVLILLGIVSFVKINSRKKISREAPVATSLIESSKGVNEVPSSGSVLPSNQDIILQDSSSEFTSDSVEGDADVDEDSENKIVVAENLKPVFKNVPNDSISGKHFFP